LYKWLLLTSWAYSIFRFFRRLGPFGLLALSALDSSFLFLPFGNDLLLIALITSSRSGPVWILYVVVAAVGSTLGALIDDLLTRRAGERGLQKFVSRKQIKQLKEQIERHGGWVIFTTTLLPPPFPFTTVIMTAAALQYPRRKLLLLVLCGRLVRFTLVAMLAVYFGKKLLVYARNSTALEYLVYALIVIALIGSTLTIVKWIKK
jgi:membrane protein YqaA with SNARE-associated domain